MRAPGNFLALLSLGVALVGCAAPAQGTSQGVPRESAGLGGDDFLGRPARSLLQDSACLNNFWDPSTIIAAFPTAKEAVCGGAGCPGQPQWSVHTCTGNMPRNRACRFKNLYYNVKARTFQYFVCPDAPARAAAFHHFGESEEFDTPKASKDHHVDKAFLFTGRYGDTIKIEKVKALPPTTNVHSWDKLVVFWSGNKPGAFGHYWVDNAYPIYLLLSNFNILNFWDFDLVLALKEMRYKKTFDHYFKGTMSTNEVVLWPKVADDLGVEYIRFTDMIAGNGRYALTIVPDNRDHFAEPNYSLSTMWWGMRKMIFQGAGLDAAAIPQKHKIVINLSKERRSVGNPSETVKCIREAFPRVEVRAIMFRKYEWNEQLALLGNTTIYIGNEGSSGFRQVFLPKGAMMIILSTPMKETAREQRYSPFHESDRWFEFMSYVNFIKYPVYANNTNEFVMRSDRLAGVESRQGERELYNLYDADINIQCERILPLVRQAMLEFSLQRVYGAHAPVTGVSP